MVSPSPPKAMLASPALTMEPPSPSNVQFPNERSKNLELHGPRPTPLKLCGDSYRIKKPPRPPIIIYTVSPKIIHAKPDEFMALVQRLTGRQSSDDRRRKVKPLARRHDKGQDESHETQDTGINERPSAVAPTSSQLFSATLASDADSGSFFDDIFTGSELQSDKGFSDVGSNDFQSVLINNPSHVSNYYPSQSSSDQFLMSSLFDM